jgi:hypothetical protein
LGDLGQRVEVLCEADHTVTNFFKRRSVWNELMGLELFPTGFLELKGWKAMDRQLPSWWTQSGQTLWLSGLIAAMEKLSRSEWRTRPLDPLELVAVRAHLARPAMARLARGSRFSLRN